MQRDLIESANRELQIGNNLKVVLFFIGSQFAFVKQVII